MSTDFDYLDESGERVIQVRKWEPPLRGRKFTQRRWNGSKWIPSIEGARLVVYRLPQVIEAVRAGREIWIAEGEKDVHSLEAAGEVATCNPMGAGKWRPEFNDWFRDASVTIVADWDPREKDYKGQAHALNIYDQLKDVAASVEIVRAKTGKDVTDHLLAHLRLTELVPVTAHELRALVKPKKQTTSSQHATSDRVVPEVLYAIVGRLAARGPIVVPSDPLGDWTVCCPVHDDHNPSATLRVGTERPIVFHCHRGCSQEDFLAWAKSEGISTADLMESKGAFGADDLASTWTPVDLGVVMRDDTSVERPTLMIRSDGAAFMYAGRVHGINSEPEAGKTWVALFVCVEVMQAGGCVVYIDFEDSAHGIAGRLLAFGLPQEQIEALFVYVRPDEPFDPAAQALIMSVLEERKPHLVVLDGITEAMSLHGLSIKDNDDSAKFMKMLPRLIARTGAAVLQLDHVTKNAEGRGRWAIGAQHKLAGIDGASYGLEALQPFGRGLTGWSKLTVFKDRPGFVRSQASGKVAGIFTLASAEDGSVTASFTPPGTVEPGSAGDVNDDVLQEVSDFLARATEPVSTADVKKGVKRKAITVDLALDWLESQGYATFETGPRKAKLWHLLRPWTPEGEQ